MEFEFLSLIIKWSLIKTTFSNVGKMIWILNFKWSAYSLKLWRFWDILNVSFLTTAAVDFEMFKHLLTRRTTNIWKFGVIIRGNKIWLPYPNNLKGDNFVHSPTFLWRHQEIYFNENCCCINTDADKFYFLPMKLCMVKKFWYIEGSLQELLNSSPCKTIPSVRQTLDT